MFSARTMRSWRDLVCNIESGAPWSSIAGRKPVSPWAAACSMSAPGRVMPLPILRRLSGRRVRSSRSSVRVSLCVRRKKRVALARLPNQERFREHVIQTWRQSGGEPDAAAGLPALLSANGFAIRSATPHIFCVGPGDYMWQWPATFIEIYLPRLIEMGRIDQKFADKVRADLTSAEKNPNALMITPLVLEIVAEKL